MERNIFTSPVAVVCGLLAGVAMADDAVLKSDEMYPLDGGGVLHVFRKDGTLKVLSPGDVEFVLVGGGGAGGDHRGGGGGGGGVVTNAAYYLAQGDYPITVGVGQKRAFTEYILNETGEVKTNRLFSLQAGQTVTTNKFAAVAATVTTFGSLFTAYPGGGGGTVRNNGSSGASGGGGGGFGGENKAGGAALYGDQGNFGHAGGSTLNITSSGASGAGGGGAGSPGEDRTQKAGSSWALEGGRGGTGVVTRITGKDFWVGGGGNGQGVTTTVPGGGGLGSTSTSSNSVGKGGNGSAMTGGGGGGSGDQGNNCGLGGDGGSGVALFRTSGELPVIPFAKDVRATGGKTVERSADGVRWCIHTFTTDDTFVLPQATKVEMLLVGGGGGGGTGGGATHAGGGGGAGRVLVMTNFLAAGEYPVVVGQGGESDASGTSSVFNGYEALGGGRGGKVRNDGGAGGCGGGGSAWGSDVFNPGGAEAVTNDVAKRIGIPVNVRCETQFGNPGGFGCKSAGGGGGGAGEPGADASEIVDTSNNKPGRGGDGVISTITGRAVCYGGGGGGGAYGAGSHRDNGGAGGGGGGGGTCSTTDPDAKSYGLPGVDGLGGGGGGGGGGSNSGISSVVGGRGGNGVVILRYPIEPEGFAIIFR